MHAIDRSFFLCLSLSHTHFSLRYLSISLSLVLYSHIYQPGRYAQRTVSSLLFFFLSLSSPPPLPLAVNFNFENTSYFSSPSNSSRKHFFCICVYIYPSIYPDRILTSLSLVVVYIIVVQWNVLFSLEHSVLVSKTQSNRKKSFRRLLST